MYREDNTSIRPPIRVHADRDRDLLVLQSDGPSVESRLISGPTGALLHCARTDGLTSVGLIVESDAQFPDPQAAKTLLTNGVTPISSVEVATHALSRVLK